VQSTVNCEEANLIGSGVSGLPVCPPAAFARLFNRPIDTDHNVAERQARASLRRANRATALVGGATNAASRWEFMRLKEWEAEHIRWAAFPHVRGVQRCNRRIVHKGECHFSMMRRVRDAKRAHNECGKFG